MKSNIRIIRMVQYLKDHERTSIKEVSRELSMSEEAVRYEIDNLNIYLEILHMEKVCRHPNGQIISKIEDEERIFEGIMPIYRLSGEERQEYLAYQLVYHHHLNISHEMENLQVSRNTVKADLKEVVHLLRRYGIDVDHWRVQSNEQNIRRFLFNEFKAHYLVLFENLKEERYIISKISKCIQESFVNYDIQVLIKFVQQTLQLTENYPLFDTFLLYTTIMVQRRFIIKSEGQVLNSSYHDPMFVEQIKGLLEPVELEFEMKLSDVEIFQLADVLTGYNTQHNNPLFEEHNIRANIFVSNLVRQVEQQLPCDFKEDEILLEGLFEHTKATMYRLKHGFGIHEDTYYRAILNHQELFEIVCRSIGELEDMMQTRLSREEISLYVVHFLGAIRRLEETTFSEKSVVLLCNSGYGTSILLRNILEVNYHVRVVDLISIYQMNAYDYQSVDLIISTIELDYEVKSLLPVPLIYISPFLNFEDVETLKHYGIKMKRNYPSFDLDQMMQAIESSAVVFDKSQLIDRLEKIINNRFATTTQSNTLFDELKEEQICYLETPLTWQQVMEIGGKMMIHQGFVESSYVEEIMASIEAYGPHFILKNKIGIPHARMDNGVLRSGMIILVMREDVIFPNQLPVRILFFVAALEKAVLLSSVMKVKEFTELETLYEDMSALSPLQLIQYFKK